MYTKGPWYINGYAYNRDDSAPTGRRVFACNYDSDICEGYTINAANTEVCQIRTHNRKDDARLIAAVPDLLSALKFVLRELHQHIPETVSCNNLELAVWEANAVIAKAEGNKGE
jgi:hypothetical protein